MSSELEEYFLCSLFDLLGCNEGDSGGVAVLCGNDLLGRPSEDVLVPLVDGVVVELSCRGDLALKVHILLHCVCDLAMCLEVGIVLNCYVDVARHSVDLAAEGVTSIVVAAAGSVLRDVLKGVQLFLRFYLYQPALKPFSYLC